MNCVRGALVQWEKNIHQLPRWRKHPWCGILLSVWNVSVNYKTTEGKRWFERHCRWLSAFKGKREASSVPVLLMPCVSITLTQVGDRWGMQLNYWNRNGRALQICSTHTGGQLLSFRKARTASTPPLLSRTCPCLAEKLWSTFQKWQTAEEVS